MYSDEEHESHSENSVGIILHDRPYINCYQCKRRWQFSAVVADTVSLEAVAPLEIVKYSISRHRGFTKTCPKIFDYPEQYVARHLTCMRSLQHSDKAGKLAKMG